ncbi:hypothetical protein GCM10018962_98170 [Dactylosporangium matsuzakiense]
MNASVRAVEMNLTALGPSHDECGGDSRPTTTGKGRPTSMGAPTAPIGCRLTAGAAFARCRRAVDSAPALPPVAAVGQVRRGEVLATSGSEDGELPRFELHDGPVRVAGRARPRLDLGPAKQRAVLTTRC